MVVRLSAAIRGAAIILICSSAAMARSEIRAVHSYTADRATIVGAVVEAINKKAIVKINDVGPLKPGRIIDFDERTMRYFDPTLRLGLIHSVKVTPLHGDDWLPGPVAER